MALWACEECGCKFAVGLPACPQCGSEDWTEDGMPKITTWGGPSYEHGPGGPPATEEQAATEEAPEVPDGAEGAAPEAPGAGTETVPETPAKTVTPPPPPPGKAAG